MKRYLILAALLVASVSCSKEGTQPSDPTTDPNTETTVTLTASLADAVTETRVSANTDSDDEWTFSWDDKDAIAAWHDEITDTPLKFEMSKFDDNNSSFSGTTGSGVNHRFIYPYEEDAAITSEGYYTIDVSSQTADKELSKTYLINDTQIETADIKDGTVSSLSMKHLGAIMVVDVYLENPIADKIYKLKGVKYSSKENAINASAEIDMTKNFDNEDLYKTVNPGTITANMDVTFTTAADDPDYLQAITRLNILPSTIRVDQSATVELTIEVYNKVNEELLETLTPSITLTNTSENNLPFDRATHNFTYLTVDGAFGAEITGATIGGWGDGAEVGNGTGTAK